jgi:hypothetical protein
VVGVEQSVERLALPQDSNGDPRAERARHAGQKPDRELVGLAALDPGDRRP